MFDTDYTLQVLAVAACLLTLATVLVYERCLTQMRRRLADVEWERDAADYHAHECQLIVDRTLADAAQAAANRHPSNVRVLRVLDGTP